MNNTLQHKSTRLLLALLLGFFATSTANAQSAANGVSFHNVESYVQNGSLHLSFDVTLEGDFLSSGDALHLHPLYRAGSEEIRLPGVLVNGKQRARFYRREQSLLSESKRVEGKPFAVIVRNNRERQQVSYNYVQPLPKGVDTRGTLQIEQLLQDCCHLALVDSKLFPLENRYAAPDPAMFANTVTYITPQSGEREKA